MTRAALATRGPYRKGVERRELLIRTAIEVFAEQGYRSSSLREIASRAEITPAGLLHHFSGKEELLLAVLERREERLAAAIELHRPRSVAEHAAVVIADGEQSACLTRVIAVVSSEASAAGHPLHELFRERRARELERITAGVVVDQARGLIDPPPRPGGRGRRRALRHGRPARAALLRRGGGRQPGLRGPPSALPRAAAVPRAGRRRLIRETAVRGPPHPGWRNASRVARRD